MAQPNAVVTVDCSVKLIPGQNLATPVPTDQLFSVSTTVSGYVAAVNTYVQGIWSFLTTSGYIAPSTPTSVDQLTVAQSTDTRIESINGVVKVQNVTAPAETYEKSGFSPEKESRVNFELGPYEAQSDTQLRQQITAQVAAAIAKTNY